jgi:hypothetical protein
MGRLRNVYSVEFIIIVVTAAATAATASSVGIIARVICICKHISQSHIHAHSFIRSLID